jgi:hypothetical protein
MKRTVFWETALTRDEKTSHEIDCGSQGCQMAYFQTQNPVLGKFWKDLQW